MPIESELSWEEDPEFAMELTVDNAEDYEPNYYLRARAADAKAKKSPRPQRNRKAPERLNYN